MRSALGFSDSYFFNCLPNASTASRSSINSASVSETYPRQPFRNSESTWRLLKPNSFSAALTVFLSGRSRLLLDACSTIVRPMLEQPQAVFVYCDKARCA
jgi:hypothetical protein